MKEAQLRTLFTASKVAQKELVVESVLLATLQEENRCSSDTKHVVFQLCLERTVFLKSFNMSCRQVMGARKRAFTDASFEALRYSAM